MKGQVFLCGLTCFHKEWLVSIVVLNLLMEVQMTEPSFSKETGRVLKTIATLIYFNSTCSWQRSFVEEIYFLIEQNTNLGALSNIVHLLSNHNTTS